jgi:hypothetical protein
MIHSRVTSCLPGEDTGTSVCTYVRTTVQYVSYQFVHSLGVRRHEQPNSNDLEYEG